MNEGMNRVMVGLVERQKGRRARFLHAPSKFVCIPRFVDDELVEEVACVRIGLVLLRGDWYGGRSKQLIGYAEIRVLKKLLGDPGMVEVRTQAK